MMKPKVAVGFESTVDIIISFPDMNDFENFARTYEGGLSKEVQRAFETVAEGSGDEEPIDGRREEAKRLLDLAEEEGAEIEYHLGGNAFQEAVTLQRLGATSIFLGGIFPRSFSNLPLDISRGFENTDTDFAEVFEEYSPASYILQAYNSNRYIFTEGEGRRIDQLRPYLRDLPDTLRKVREKHGTLDVLSLVGWQVLFGEGLPDRDCQLTQEVIKKIRSENEFLLFTDGGGIGGLNDEEKKMFWKIYTLFDILSLNEDELLLLTKILDFEYVDEVRSMSKILEESENLSTVWVHTPNYQITLTEEFGKDCIKRAQEKSALAGLYKVESGNYPSSQDLDRLEEERPLIEKGLEKKREIEDQYGSEIGEYEIIVTPCYEEESFVSTVGAGDVSSAGYLNSIIRNRK